ncbi:TPA: hypothetical protein OMQ51_002121 [Acinetobacter baumannii]|uniref:hypothetical protein n=1 Tax=Acinetobacter baumannii TaxID=470 RepID=UPI001C0E7E24|nr:hypothetical protein [Acinetobacter baumannii]MBU3079631.1 hypothetical protein [Acinetobacter baumannii]MDC5136786.1 hypothetical protein [Acinetobacter baumannii]MDC5230937.1 hypothetical protein [Acinetobacter baumannii]HCQ9886008.1 hypothetical protein [Acinetobacter baumannii]
MYFIQKKQKPQCANTEVFNSTHLYKQEEKYIYMEHFKPIVELIKVSIEKYGLWQTIVAFILLFSAPILMWKLDVIIASIKA